MTPAEQRRRMLRLRNQVRRANLGAWLEAFVGVVEGVTDGEPATGVRSA
jgi:hypothetical protein